MALRVPSGSQRGTAKHDRPPGAWASIRNRSLMGAEQNHLCPTSRYSSPGPPPLVGIARVVLARTSEPPCFSVMAMPAMAPCLPTTGMGDRSYVREVSLGSHTAASSGWARRAGTTE
jgi:hypothetical protein